METHIKVVGWLLVFLSIMHIGFPRYFKWKAELINLSLINRQIFAIHTLFIAFTVFLMGMLCTTSAPDLVETELGRRISLGLGIFWLLRLIIQFFGYSSNLWRGSKWKTVAHIIFSMVWLYMSMVFLISAFY